LEKKMNKNKALPIGTIFMILVIALAVLGVGYALWSETLTISGTVSTGEVDVEFSMHDPEECVDVNGVEECPVRGEKADAADCMAVFSGPDNDSNDDDGPDLLTVTVTGMYPSYHCKVSFDVTSTGNVPVHVWQPVPTGDIPEWIATDFEECYEDGVQLHQGEGENSTGYCTIDIHFTNADEVPENSGPITFGWEILATQWNEDPPTADIITVQSNVFNLNNAGGWAGWSCPADHPYVVGGDDSNCTLPLAVSQPAKPGVGTYPNYPHYNYIPPEQGWVVQNGGTAQSCYITVDCSDTAP
jgi:hypothetical protein